MLFFLNTSCLFAKDAVIVQISMSQGDSTQLTPLPPNLFVKKNTVVIWMNAIEGEEIQVLFKDGKACQEVSLSPEFRGFSLDSKSCFVTNFIPYSKTSSLEFTEPGTFEYTISNTTGQMSGKGKIIVREM